MSGEAAGDQDLVFNARWLTPDQVAATFVAPPYFRRLAAATHTLLVGPRGSGKTTLLKMLQPKALESWGAAEADDYRQSIRYTGVFVPADISWKEQIKAVASGLSENMQQKFSHAAFTTSVLHALVDAAIWRTRDPKDARSPFRRACLPRDCEETLAKHVTGSWSLPPGVPSLLSVKHRLRSRLSELPLVLGRLKSDAETADVLSDPALAFLGLETLDCVSLFIEIFDDYVGESDAKWALLFDEMEIAPEWIQKTVFKSTRSRNDKLLLKVALSPYTAQLQMSRDGTAPSPLNDFEQIQLWFAQRDQDFQHGGQRHFCEALWRTTLSQQGYPETNPYVALGESFALTEDDREDVSAARQKAGASGRKRAGPYSPDGKWGLRFQNLHSKDESFREYIAKHGISVDALDELPENVRARVVRKVMTVVSFREYYRAPDKSDGLRMGATRSRKSAELYAGADTFFMLSEGHPRWLKVTLKRMLENTPQHALKISASKQGREVLAFAQRFAALLKTYPSPVAGGAGPSSVWALIRHAGEYFYEQVVEGPFDPEPNLSFIVDSNSDDSIVALVQVAVNLGALVYVPEGEGEILLNSVRGKRFRISYWLAPLLKLPPTLGKAVSLSAILGHRRASRRPLSLDLPLGID